MKGLILAAGHGTRLRPLTYTRPKPVIRVAGRPIIAYAVDNLLEVGVEEIGVVVSPKTRDEIAAALEGTPRARFTFIVQEDPQGLAHAVKVARDWLGEDPFLMYLGDNLFENGVAALTQAFERERPSAAIALVEVEDPRQFGVAVVEDGRIVRLVEKPKDPPSRLAVAGVYAFTPAIHEVIEKLEPSARGEYEITDAIQGLIDAGARVLGVPVVGWWKDTGRPHDLLEANRLLLARLAPRVEGEVEESRIEGPVVVERGARLKNARILGPALIAEDAVVEDAFIGPYTAVGPGAVVKDAEVEHSILEAKAHLEGVRIHGSLLGVGAEVKKLGGRPRTPRLILGDLSRVEVPD